ncbi:hypothetical protein AS361_01505 [Myroides marinus]|uniref:hypothetical protein n=1 Tax=Myroides marinus TaxID=703342 RepID=UPI000742014F|nr:hypothetical protein [Myroides marinus]KUF41718.1 hypothetical protein AS361_01505 [Myroides marinus]
MKNIILLFLVITLISCQKQYNTDQITIVTRQKIYDPKYKTYLSVLKIDETYFKTISEQQKAALGYVITFVGNECQWQDQANKTQREGLICKLLSALDLGEQCSEKHLSFLRSWFKKDVKVLDELKTCPTIPETSTVQTMFNSIKISQVQSKIIVFTEEVYINSREDYSKTFQKEYSFHLDNNTIKLDTIILKPKL